MKTNWIFTVLAIAVAALPAHADETLSHGRFATVTLYRPAGDVKSVVLFLSGDGGWNQGVVDMAQALAARRRDGRRHRRAEAARQPRQGWRSCVSPDGDLENLSHYIQGYAKLPTYHTPRARRLFVGRDARVRDARAGARRARSRARCRSGSAPTWLLHKNRCAAATACTSTAASRTAASTCCRPRSSAVLDRAQRRAGPSLRRRALRASSSRRRTTRSFVELPKVGHGYSRHAQLDAAVPERVPLARRRDALGAAAAAREPRGSAARRGAGRGPRRRVRGAAVRRRRLGRSRQGRGERARRAGHLRGGTRLAALLLDGAHARHGSPRTSTACCATTPRRGTSRALF